MKSSGPAIPPPANMGGQTGLANNRNLARMFGGDLTTESELGIGSIFTPNIHIEFRRAV